MTIAFPNKNRSIDRLNTNKCTGISLVELLILLAILSLAAAVAVPSFMLRRMTANEAGAIQGLKLIASAELAYAASNENRFADIDTLVKAELLDSRYRGGASVNSYRYLSGDVAGTDLDGEVPTSFGFLAIPEPGAGRFIYAIAPDQLVRYQGPAEGFKMPAGVAAGSAVETG